ncbi:nuclear transport factor 2 family protein [Novosphingobium sp. BL-52-GroH]|uniref:nuclear transport factor 2 family protein n=1 Tax=Novosphingobium sp. BL-52-GroH TaxID=3349877 RepID=UPI00384E3CA6
MGRARRYLHSRYADRLFQNDGRFGGLAEIKRLLAQSLTPILAFQHAVSTTRYQIAGETARTRTVCTNPMTVDDGGPRDTLVFGLWNVHDFVRTGDGWRISRLYEQKCDRLNVPDWLGASLPDSSADHPRISRTEHREGRSAARTQSHFPRLPDRRTGRR